MKSGIYKIINKVNNKIYIGSVNDDINILQEAINYLNKFKK